MEEEGNSERLALNENDAEKPEVMSKRERLRIFLNCDPVQYTIIALVVIDSLICIFELLVDIDVIYIPDDDGGPEYYNASSELGDSNYSTHSSVNHHHLRTHGRSYFYNSFTDSYHLNSSSHSGNYSDDHLLYNDTLVNNTSLHHEGHHGHSTKEKVEHGLHMASLTILSIFVVEVVSKLIAEGTHFFHHKAEVFDAFIVLVSFSLDVLFSFISVDDAAKDAAGLMVLLRLWRVTRIVNGVIMSVKKDADKKIAEQKAARAKAEQEVKVLKEKIEGLQKEVESLKGRLDKSSKNPDSNHVNDKNPDSNEEETPV